MSASSTRPQDAREIVDIPMFDIAEIPPPVTSRPFPGPRTVRQVQCAGGEHRAGLIAGVAEHLVWRNHQIHTSSGGSYPCPASGRCLCQVPAPDRDGIQTPTCDDHGPFT